MNTKPLPELHPACEIYPAMEGDDTDDIAGDIRQFGYDDDQKIVMIDGRLLDGRNRWNACNLAGVDPEKHTREFDEETEGSPLQFVVRHNSHRRHLTPGQRAMAAANMVPLFEEAMRAGLPPADNEEKFHEGTREEMEAVPVAEGETATLESNDPPEMIGGSSGELKVMNDEPPAETEPFLPAAGTPPPEATGKTAAVEKAAEATGASERTVFKADSVKNNRPDLWKKCEADEISISAAYDRMVNDEKLEKEKKERRKLIDRLREHKKAGKITEGFMDGIEQKKILKSQSDLIVFADFMDGASKSEVSKAQGLLSVGWRIPKIIKFVRMAVDDSTKIVDLKNVYLAKEKPKDGGDWKTKSYRVGKFTISVLFDGEEAS